MARPAELDPIEQGAMPLRIVATMILFLPEETGLGVSSRITTHNVNDS
jgi:hypothetical protein